jgi:hypothetical protein
VQLVERLENTLELNVNDELKALAMAAGAPEDVMDELWFSIFCKQFAHLLLEEMEKTLDA